MTGAIHGHSHRAIHFLREHPATLAVYWIYASRTNKDNVAWSSLRGLVKSTGWSINECSAARDWLIEHEALEVVEDYVRPDWRKLPEKQRNKKVGLDRTLYLRPTGYLTVQAGKYPLLYFGGSETASELEENDVSPHETSPRDTSKSHRGKPVKQADVSRGDISQGTTSYPGDVVQRDTELDSLSQLDSSSFELDTSSNLEQPSTIFRLFEDNIGLLSPLIKDELVDLQKDFPEQWIRDAIKEAALNNARSVKYVGKILERWKKDGKGHRTQNQGSAPSATPSANEHYRAQRQADLQMQILKTLPDAPPDAYMPCKPQDIRESTWKSVGRFGWAKRLADEQERQAV